MRKKEVLAMIMVLMLGLSAGCAPGDISRYAAKAQQAGERLLEGKTVSAAAEMADAAGEAKAAVPEATAPESETGFNGQQEKGSETESVTEPETETFDDAETVEEPEAESEPESTEKQQTESDSESTEEKQTESETAAPQKGTDTPDSDGAQQEQIRSAELPAMMQEVEERPRTALAEKAESINGVLAGKDALTKEQSNAVQAVLLQKGYNDRTLCLINSARFEEKETGSFLLFCDSTALTARGRISGDLWFYSGEKAVRVLENTDFMRLQPIQCGGRNFLLVQTDQDEKVSAQIYRVKDGRAVSCFADAVSIGQEGDELCVNYKADHIQYDPLSEDWSGGEAEITYYYVPGEEGFEQESVRELTAEQYLAYIQPDENDADAQRFQKEQEEKFYQIREEKQEYCYSFFAVGDSRIGYRECRIGMPEEEPEGSGHAAAEYRYHLARLENGKLTQQCETLSGSGYYFAQWDQKKEELQKLSEIPAAYLKNRTDRAGRMLRAKECAALQRVQAVQEYDTDGLCFVEQADYDGSGGTESFVAIGRYDGILDAAICDLWFVSGEDAVLLEEKLPVRNVLSFETGGISLFLAEGVEADGSRDRLYGVREAAAQRYLENASEIEVEENGDLTARMKGGEGERPYYYHILNGEVTEYGVQEREPETLLDYDNGRAVYRHLQRLADLQEGALSCLVRENGLIHVMLTDRNGGVSYETYRVQNGSLVLTDCGEGGYEAAVQKTEEEE